MKKIVLVVFIFSSIVAKSQDPHFTQPTSSFTHLNPALIGKDQNNTAFLTYRNQWPKMEGTYKATFAGYYHYLSKINGYLGADIMQDDAGNGTLISSSFSLNYAQNIKMGNLLFRPAFKASYIQKRLDFSKLTFGDMIDQQLGFVNATSETILSYTQAFNLNAGFVSSWKGFNLGFSVNNFNEPKESFIGISSNRLPARYVIHLDKTIE